MATPTILPAITAPKINLKLMISFKNNVATTAMNIPKDEIRFPFLAVAGELKFFNPTINKKTRNYIN